MSVWEWVGVGVAGYAVIVLSVALVIGRACQLGERRVSRGPLDEHGDGTGDARSRGEKRVRAAPLPSLARRGRAAALSAAAVFIVLGALFGVAEWTLTGLVLVVAGLILAAGA